MRATTALRCAVFGEIALVVVTITLSETLSHTLPEELQRWQGGGGGEAIVPMDILMAFGFLGLLPMAIVSWAGLLFLRRWAAWTYLAVVALGYSLVALSGDPNVEVPIAGVFDDLSSVASGLVLGIAFLSDALKPRRKIEDAPQPPVLSGCTQVEFQKTDAPTLPPVLSSREPTPMPASDLTPAPPVLMDATDSVPPVLPETRDT